MTAPVDQGFESPAANALYSQLVAEITVEVAAGRMTARDALDIALGVVVWIARLGFQEGAGDFLQGHFASVVEIVRASSQPPAKLN